MRLQNISSVAEANQWIEHFMSDFNRKRAARTVLTGMCYSVGSATRQAAARTRLSASQLITSSTWRR
jgi:hypothetical protein